MKLTGFARMLLLSGVLPLAACGGLASRNTTAGVIAQQGYFFVGGRYTQTKDGQIMTGQMFVQYQIPRERRHAVPIVMWHGGGQTGTNFLGTPDGRKGWAEYFLERGYAVYVVDQPARARSGFFTEVYGTTRRPTTQNVSDRFTAPAREASLSAGGAAYAVARRRCSRRPCVRPVLRLAGGGHRRYQCGRDG